MKVKDALKRFRREFQLKQVEVAKILGVVGKLKVNNTSSK